MKFFIREMFFAFFCLPILYGVLYDTYQMKKKEAANEIFYIKYYADEYRPIMILASVLLCLLSGITVLFYSILIFLTTILVLTIITYRGIKNYDRIYFWQKNNKITCGKSPSFEINESDKTIEMSRHQIVVTDKNNEVKSLENLNLQSKDIHNLIKWINTCLPNHQMRFFDHIVGAPIEIK